MSSINLGKKFGFLGILDTRLARASGGQACRSLLCRKHCSWLRRCQETAERRELEELRHRAEAVEQQEKKEEELFGDERKDVFFCF